MARTLSHYISFISLGILLVLYALTTLGYMGPDPIGEASGLSQPLIVPAGYAFAIWTPIYLFLIIFPFYQWIKRVGNDPDFNKLRIWYSVNVILNGLWLVFASFNMIWATVIIIIAMLITLIRIHTLLLGLEESEKDLNYWTEQVGFRIYFAWITIATALNITGTLQQTGWDGFGISELNWSLIILAVVAIIAGVVSWKYKSIPYALVVIWAFLALLVKHWNSTEILAYMAVAVLMVFSVITILILRKRRQIRS